MAWVHDQLVEGCYYLKSHWESRNGIEEKIYHRCNFAYTLKVIRFYNPDDLKDCKDAILCEMHYIEVFAPILRPIIIAESYIGSENRKIAKARRGFRERADWDMLFQFNANPDVFQQLDHRKINLRRLQETCRHEDCENSIKGRSRQIFSISIMNQRGGSEGKINFCSFQCWNKIRKYIGIIRPVMTNLKPTSLESYM